MATWKNLDTLDSFGKLKELKNHVDIAAALSGEEGGKRVADYSTPMAAGLSYNYAAKEVDETVLSALAKLADEAQLIDKFQELYNPHNPLCRSGYQAACSCSGYERSVHLQALHRCFPLSEGILRYLHILPVLLALLR